MSSTNTQIQQIPSVTSHPSKRPNSNLQNNNIMRDQRTPMNLLLAVSHAAEQRQQEGKQHREEQQEMEHKWEEEHVLRPQRELDQKQEEEEKVEKLIAEMFEEELEAWRMSRDKKEQVDRLSRAEVDEKVLRMVEEVHRVTGLGKRRMEDGTEESHKEWRERMVDLRGQIYEIWNENCTRIRMGLPRYVEGNPVREGIDPPKFVSEKRQMMSGLGACLQCEVKEMGCSRCVATGRKSGKLLKSKGCTRCEREGYRCIVAWEVDDDEEEEEEEGKGGEGRAKTKYVWDWADESDTEPVAEALEMWERRRRGTKLELMGGSMQWVEVGGFAPRGGEKNS